MNLAIEIAGWGGAVLIVGAYGLLSAGRLSPQSPAYQILNIAGSLGFVVNSGWYGAYPSTAVNVVWMAIGITALLHGRRVSST